MIVGIEMTELYPIYLILSRPEHAHTTITLTQEEIDEIREVERKFYEIQDKLSVKWIRATQKNWRAK